MNDSEYRKSVREIIKRDFFPELCLDKIDETLEKFRSLNSFCARCVNAGDSDFVAQIEADRQELHHAAPKDKRGDVIKDQNPWKSSAHDPLFFEPPRKMLTHKSRVRPEISHEQTRFTTVERPSLSRISYDESTTTSESESEFEGRSQFRQEFMRVSRDRIERRKRMNQLSSKGRDLLKSLDPL